MPEMYRGKSQVLFRYTPNSRFRFNETYAWCEVTSIEMRNTQDLPKALQEELSNILLSWNAISPNNFPDPNIFPNKYEVGEPYQVRYTLTPLVFTCRVCKRVEYYSNLDTLMSVNYNLKCRGCNNERSLVQTPYAYIHECGRSETLYVPKHERSHKIIMINRGNFQESYWFCQTCNNALTQPGKGGGLGKRACSCAARQLMRGTTLQDPSVQYTRTVSIVNTQGQVLDRISEKENYGPIILGGVIRAQGYERSMLIDLLKPEQKQDFNDQQIQSFRDNLIAQNIDPSQIGTILSAMQGTLLASSASKDAQLVKEVQEMDSSQTSLVERVTNSRNILEYLFVRDHQSMQSVNLAEMIAQAQAQNDEISKERYLMDSEIANRLGFSNLQLIEKFPLMLASVGYSRVNSSPQPDNRTVLRPFIADKPKIPIYAVNTTTEAMMFELDPWREAAWLIENQFAVIPETALKSESKLRFWLTQQKEIFLTQREAHLELKSWEKDRGITVNKIPALLFGLTHSVSHVLIISARSQVGFDADSLAEYLFPIASSGVIYATGHQQFTLGGIVSAFKMSLGFWLDATYQDTQRCIYNPVCRSRGGACHACAHLRFSCQYFNRTQSRSFLVGGPISGLNKEVIGFWSLRVFKRATFLKSVIEESKN